jgi:hypothetical protein
MDRDGISLRLVRFAMALVGHLRGGLQQVFVVTIYLVSGISGSKVADVQHYACDDQSAKGASKSHASPDESKRARLQYFTLMCLPLRESVGRNVPTTHRLQFVVHCS